MRGFPHSNEPEKTMKEELWVGVTPSGWSPMKRIPMKRDPEGYEAKGRGLHIKPDETQTPLIIPKYLLTDLLDSNNLASESARIS